MSFFSLKKFFSKSSKLSKFFPKKGEKKDLTHYPLQHPKNIESNNQEIIQLQRPASFISPEREVPFSLYETPLVDGKEISPAYSKGLEVCLIGAPNAGKSTLFNRLLGSPISAVSSKSNTTDEAIKGFYTNKEKLSQIIFHDTPGIIQVYKNTNHFVTQAWDVVTQCDKALLIVDSVKAINNPIKEAILRLKKMKLDEKHRRKLRNLNQKEFSMEHESKSNEDSDFGDTSIPTILVMNKIDLCTNKRKLRFLIDELEDIGKFEKTFFTSAETGYGIRELLTSLEEECYPRPWEMEPSMPSEQSEIEKIQQLFKSVIYERFYYEVPYRLGHQVSEFRMRSDGFLKVGFVIHTQSKSQLPIVLGYHGRNIKFLKEMMQAKLAAIYQKKVHVNIIVKVAENPDLNIQENELIVDSSFGVESAKKEVDMMKQGFLTADKIRR